VSCWNDSSSLGIFNWPRYTVSSSTMANIVCWNSPVSGSSSSYSKANSFQLVIWGDWGAMARWRCDSIKRLGAYFEPVFANYCDYLVKLETVS